MRGFEEGYGYVAIYENWKDKHENKNYIYFGKRFHKTLWTSSRYRGSDRRDYEYCEDIESGEMIRIYKSKSLDRGFNPETAKEEFSMYFI